MEFLPKYIVQAVDSNALDVLEVFNFLRNGSYQHYWSFDAGLKNMGVLDGVYIRFNSENNQCKSCAINRAVQV